MRRLNARDTYLLVALGVAAIVGLLALQDDSPGRGRANLTIGRGVSDLGDPPVVRLHSLARPTPAYDSGGRDPFGFKGSHPRPSEISSSTEGSTASIGLPGPRSSAHGSRKRSALAYIGYLGPKDDVVAVFTKDTELFVAGIGDVVDGRFELIEFRYDTVVLGCVRGECESPRLKLRMEG